METETRYRADIKRESILIHYFKSLMVSIKIDFKKLYYLGPTKLDRNPGMEKICIPG
jgi:hypothetical protein